MVHKGQGFDNLTDMRTLSKKMFIYLLNAQNDEVTKKKSKKKYQK